MIGTTTAEEVEEEVEVEDELMEEEEVEEEGRFRGGVGNRGGGAE